MNEDLRVKEGLEIIKSMWYILANNIVSMAKDVYNLNEDQYKALKEVCLRSNDYVCELDV